VASELETDRGEAALADAAAAVPDIQQQIVFTEISFAFCWAVRPAPSSGAPRCLRKRMPPEVRPGCLPPCSNVDRMCARRTTPAVRQCRRWPRRLRSFSQIGLTAFFGKVSPGLSAVTLGSANAWSLAASASGPLFEGGD